MAFKAKKPGSSKQKKKRYTKPFFLNEKFRLILGIFVLLGSAYLLVAFISFLFFGAADQSKLDLPWKELVLNSDIKVENKAGKTGAFLSEKIINRGFGVASFLFIYLLVVTGFKILGRNLVKYRRTLVFSLLSVLWISVALGFLFPKTSASSFIYPGGQYGFVLGNWFSALIGKVGLLLLLFITGLSILVVRFEKAFALIKRLFQKKEKPEGERLPVSGDEKEEIAVADDSISKVIDEEDNIRAFFEPDGEEDMEIRRAEEPVQPDDKDNQKAKAEEDELELTVQQKKEEEVDEEFSGEGMEDYDPTLELSSYKFPTLELLEDHSSGNAEVSNEELIANKNKIVETLRHYKIEITKIRATIGPTITLYEIVPAPGIRIVKIKNLEDDIALSLAALGHNWY